MFDAIRAFWNKMTLGFKVRSALKTMKFGSPEFNQHYSDVERNQELRILQIIGTRDPGAADRLSDYYMDERAFIDREDGTRKWLGEPEFTLEECRMIVSDDAVFKAYTEKYLHVWRDIIGLEAMRTANLEFYAMLGRDLSIY